MGMIRIELGGSFGGNIKVVSAMQNGHADAVAQVLEWLAAEVLPCAIALDHKLHDEGEKPEQGFARSKP